MGNRTRISTAFAALRKQGFIAKASFMCCGGCAGSAIADLTEELVDAGKSPLGAVYFTKQCRSDAMDALERVYTQSDIKKVQLLIGYGTIDTSKHGVIGLPAVDVGAALVAALREAGLEVDWDGDPDKKIGVSANAALFEETV